MHACFASSAVGDVRLDQTDTPLDERPVEARITCERPLRRRPDQDPVGLERVVEGAALPQELGIGDDVDRGAEVGTFQPSAAWSRSALPAGTVDFWAITSGPVASPRDLRAPPARPRRRFASPEARGGVPTQMKTTSASATASPVSATNRSEPAAIVLASSSASRARRTASRPLAERCELRLVGVRCPRRRDRPRRDDAHVIETDVSGPDHRRRRPGGAFSTASEQRWLTRDSTGPVIRPVGEVGLDPP